MHRLTLAPRITVVLLSTLLGGGFAVGEPSIQLLPEPNLGADKTLRDALRERRSVRSFTDRPLSLHEAAQLVWAAQGISSDRGLRTAPSAGALYPLELHLVAGRVEGLSPGIYRYDPKRHALQAESDGDRRAAIAEAALNQEWIVQAPAIVVIAAVERRTTPKYGRRGVRYVHIEAGHAGQNLLLQAVALGLGGTTVGAFDDDELAATLQLPSGERPLLVLPVGQPR